MGHGVREHIPTEYARNLALSLVRSGPPQERLLTLIYRDSLTRPLSQGLEDLVLRMELGEDEPGQVQSMGSDGL
jgi:hypothetical protein